MRCLIYEPDHTGHHFAHLRQLIPAVAALAPEIVLVTDQRALNTPEYRAHLEPLASRFRVAPAAILHPPFAVARSAWQLTQGLVAAVRRHRPDHVYVPYADAISQVLGVRRLGGERLFRNGVEAEGLIMRGHFAYPARTPAEWLGARLSYRAMRLAPWTRAHQIDPIPFEMIRRRDDAFARQTRLMPEPVEPIPGCDPTTARLRLGLPVDGRYVGCAGWLDFHKGVDLLTAAFARGRGDRDRLLLVGQLSPRLRTLLHERYHALVTRNELIVLDRFVTDVELTVGLSAMDVVALPYPRHIGSSGIALRAVAVGRPLVGSDFGWIGRTIRRFSLGATCRVNDIEEFAATLRAALDAAQQYQRTEAADRLVQFHTASNFAAAWTVRLRERLDLALPSAPVTWHWVLEGLPGNP